MWSTKFNILFCLHFLRMAWVFFIFHFFLESEMNFYVNLCNHPKVPNDILLDVDIHFGFILSKTSNIWILRIFNIVSKIVKYNTKKKVFT